MLTAIYRVFFAILLSVTVTSLSICQISKDAHAKSRAFYDDATPEAWSQHDALHRDVGWDPQRSRFVRETNSNDIELLIATLESTPHYLVQRTSVSLLRFVLRDQVLNDQSLEKIRRATSKYYSRFRLEEIDFGPTYDNAQGNEFEAVFKEDMISLLNAIWWNVKYKKLAEESERLSYLGAALHPGARFPEKPQIVDDAIEHLVAIGSPEAEAILMERLASARSNRRSSFSEKLEVALTKIRIKRSILEMTEDARVGYLMGHFHAVLRHGDHPPTPSYGAWLMRLLAATSGDAADQPLKEIWANRDLRYHLRFEVQELLVERGSLQPEDRMRE